MLFHTQEFAILLAVLLLLFSVTTRWMTLLVMIAASYTFYGWAKPVYAFLLFGITVFNYFVAVVAEKTRVETTRRRITMAVSVAVNFGALGYFKYGDFAVENVHAVLQTMGLAHGAFESLHIYLPIGVSFFIFQSFAYSMDVILGRIDPCKNFLLYVLFVSWFPQLVAGPIERPQTLIPELLRLDEKRKGMALRVPKAVSMYCEGYLRKMCADVLAPVSESFFANPAPATTSEAIIGIVAFGLQIYGDFSGYTRMAQGVSWLFGVRLMENFDRPYLARDFKDFWRRWHISLSTWFRDYVYIPLGGNRNGPVRAGVNMMGTMLISGLWHGAGWTFVFWGFLHGLYLLINNHTGFFWKRAPAIVSIPLVWVFVFLAWTPFRATSFTNMLEAYQALGHGGFSAPSMAFMFGALGLVFCDVFHVRFQSGVVVAHRFFDKGLKADHIAATALWIAVCVTAGAIQWAVWGAEKQPFIYFQF